MQTQLRGHYIRGGMARGRYDTDRASRDQMLRLHELRLEMVMSRTGRLRSNNLNNAAECEIGRFVEAVIAQATGGKLMARWSPGDAERAIGALQGELQ